MSTTDLPHLNAFLNSTSAVLLCCGYVAIRRRNKRLHARLMVTAFAVSVAFLISYLVYHYQVGHTTYDREGWWRGVYLAILVSHIILAVVTVPLVVGTLILAARGSFDRHRKVARWTFPIWLYVSITGVIVYAMLYHL